MWERNKRRSNTFIFNNHEILNIHFKGAISDWNFHAVIPLRKNNVIIRYKIRRTCSLIWTCQNFEKLCPTKRRIEANEFKSYFQN